MGGNPHTYQSICCHLRDGRKFWFSGPGGLKDGDVIERWEVFPEKPLPVPGEVSFDHLCYLAAVDPVEPRDSFAEQVKARTREVYGAIG